MTGDYQIGDQFFNKQGERVEIVDVKIVDGEMSCKLDNQSTGIRIWVKESIINNRLATIPDDELLDW